MVVGGVLREGVVRVEEVCGVDWAGRERGESIEWLCLDGGVSLVVVSW